jgi:TPP-dependent pyruvate/acetoin dehydrogenase alpha subunit
MSIHTSDDQQLVQFWIDMHRIRAFEQSAVYQSSIGNIYGALHSCEGQESCCVGICAALEEGDYIASTHRGHGHCLAMGASMERMMAELFGRIDGYCKGKGGSLHITDLSVGMLGANGIVGAGFAIAAGAALNAKVSNNGRIALVFFGDGAITRGTFHEVMNMAALWKLPLILVCENNGYAQYVSSKDTMVFDDIASLAQNYKMPGLCLDGNDIQAVYSQAKDAISNARNGLGPCLIELKTQRFQGHSSGDPQVYRSKSDVEALKKNRDPIAALEQVLLDKALLPNRESLLQQVEAEVNRAVAFALASPYPDDAEVGTDVYSEGVRHA